MEKTTKPQSTKKNEKTTAQKNMAGNKAFSSSKKAPVKIHKTAPRGK